VGPTRTAAAAARNRLHAQRASGARGGELGRRASQPKGGRGEGAPAGPRRRWPTTRRGRERGKQAVGGRLGHARKPTQERRGVSFYFSISYLAITFY
jgi:hypothetical protein